MIAKRCQNIVSVGLLLCGAVLAVAAPPTAPRDMADPAAAWVKAADHAADPVLARLDLIDLSELVERVRAEHKLPAAAAAVTDRGRVVAGGVAGVRVSLQSEPATLNDLWSWGSITKSITASIAAELIEEGELEWESRVDAVLPAAALPAEPALAARAGALTLRQLLTHRAGLPAGTVPDETFRAIMRLKSEGRAARVDATRLALSALPPAEVQPQRFVYSNYGYLVAGAMMEAITDRAWEDLVRDRIFTPLGLESAGFDSPLRGGKAGPRGHQLATGLGLYLREPAFGIENPRATGPAGSVHGTVLDLARYARWHLSGLAGGAERLKAEGFTALHTPEKPFAADEPAYAMGWIVTPRDGETVHWHNGSIGGWNYALIALYPKRDIAIALCFNAGPNVADPAADELLSRIAERYPLEHNPERKSVPDTPEAKDSSEADEQSLRPRD